jgi:hypothetical protein
VTGTERPASVNDWRGELQVFHVEHGAVAALD